MITKKINIINEMTIQVIIKHINEIDEIKKIDDKVTDLFINLR
jgi:hypothetical protein